jgi:hypothetical protein
MLRKMVEPLGEVCSVTRRLLRRGLGLQTSRHVNVFFLAKGRILFEQPMYSAAPTCFDTYVSSSGSTSVRAELHAN